MKAFLAIFVCFSVILSAGCGTQTPEISEDRLSIAVIPKGTTHEFWKAVNAGAQKAGQELDVQIIWKGPLKEDDRSAQIDVVEDFITLGVSGIVLAPLDDTALQSPVNSAVRAGIPVVIIDSDLQGDDFISFVATDNYKGGELASHEMARLLGNTGRIVILRYQEGSASTMNREQGFLDAIRNYPGITVVSDNQYGGATTESAFQASENLLAPLRSGDSLTIDGIFCPNESTTFGMLRALQNLGVAGKTKFIGFDSSDKLVEALENEQIHAIVLQDPFNMGYLGVKTMVQHLMGEQVEKRIDTGAVLVTTENMDEPEIRSLLQPDLN